MLTKMVDEMAVSTVESSDQLNDKKQFSLSGRFNDLCSEKSTYMKKSLLSILSLLPLGLMAQVPNGGMETWANGTPDQWSSNNIPGIATPVTQTSNAHNGSSAVRLDVVSSIAGDFPGFISSTGTGGSGFAVTQNYGSISFYYKTNLTGGDVLDASVIFSDFNTQPTAGGSIQFGINQSVYTQGVIPVNGSGPNPVTCLIYFAMGNSGTPHIGSWAQIDDIAFGGPVGVDELTADGISLSAPNPNPASGIALVPFTLDRTTVADIRVFDLNGRLVQNVLNQELSAGKYKAEINTAALSAGVYQVVMLAGDQQRQVKLVVQ